MATQDTPTPEKIDALMDGFANQCWAAAQADGLGMVKAVDLVRQGWPELSLAEAHDLVEAAAKRALGNADVRPVYNPEPEPAALIITAAAQAFTLEQDSTMLRLTWTYPDGKEDTRCFAVVDGKLYDLEGECGCQQADDEGAIARGAVWQNYAAPSITDCQS